MSVNVGKAIGYLDLDTSGFTKGFKSALQELQAFRNSASSMGDKVTALGSAMTKAGSTMTKSVTLPLVGLGTAAVATTTKFESAMSKVSAISGATGDDLAALTDKAKEMGAKTKFSASESAEAFQYMAMAGWKTEDMLDGIDGIMNLAAADGLDLATTSDIVTDALTAFGLSASDSAHFADVLAKASSSANTNVSMLGESFKYVAPVAGSLGYSAEDTAIALGLMANAGIKGSQSGTALRGALTRLIKPTDDAAALMEEYGLSLTNSDGSMKSLGEVMSMLRSNLGDLTEAEQAQIAAALFGQEAMSGMLSIINASDKDFQNLTDQIYGADGAAKQMADTMLDNLSGQLIILKSSLEGAAIAFGELLLPLIKKITSAIQGLVDWVNNLSDRQKAIIVTIAGVLAVVGPILIIGGKIVKLVGSVMGVIKVLKPAIAALNAVMLANPIILIITLIAGLIAALVTLYKKNETFRNFVDETWASIKNVVSTVVNALVTFFTETIPNALQSAIDWVKNFAHNIATFFTETIPEKISQLFDWFTRIPENIGYALGYALGTIARWIVDAWNSIEEGVPKIIESIGKFFSELPGKIWQALLGVIDTLVKWITQAIEWAKTEIPKFILTVVNFYLSLPGKIWNALLSALDKVKQWGTQLLSWAKTKIPEVVSSIIGFFKQLPTKIVEVGTNLVKGLWNGIKGAASWLKDKILGFGDSILSGFKKAFGIASPSKKTKEMGKYLAEGLSLGIEDNEDMVIDSADSLAGGLLETLRSLMEKLSGVVKLVSNPFDALDKQKQAYDAITQSINNQISALRTLKALQEAFFIGTTLLYGEDALESFNDHSMASQRHSGYSDSSISGSKGVSYSFTFYSPEAINPTSAAKLMKQTAQQMSMDMS